MRRKNTSVSVTFFYFQHAEQVKKAAAEYKDFKEKQDEKEAPKIRTKRDWFATLTPEQVRLYTQILSDS